MNAIELLLEDHTELRTYFGEFKAADTDDKKHKIFEDIKAKLSVHTHIEEKIFYPKVMEHKELEDITKEGIEEHHLGDVFVREISNLVDDSGKFDPKMEVLIESTEHHLMEEEGKMFPKVKKLFSEKELEELGKEMREEEKSFKDGKFANA